MQTFRAAPERGRYLEATDRRRRGVDAAQALLSELPDLGGYEALSTLISRGKLGCRLKA